MPFFMAFRSLHYLAFAKAPAGVARDVTALN
jgi:hypothetical protein